MLEFRKANLKDIPTMQELVKKEIENGAILPRSSDEIATSIRSYTMAILDEQMVGYSALHIYSDQLAEIRSLIIKDGVRGHGIGTKLVKELLKEASKFDIKKVFALTYEKSFFESIGFKEIQKEELPHQKIWADCIKCKHFPTCNEIAMIYIF